MEDSKGRVPCLANIRYVYFMETALEIANQIGEKVPSVVTFNCRLRTNEIEIKWKRHRKWQTVNHLADLRLLGQFQVLPFADLLHQCRIPVGQLLNL